MTDKNILKAKRKKRIRSKVLGSSNRPRFSVYRSLRHSYAQLIDDEEGRTLVSASSTKKGINTINRMEAAKQVGKEIAKRALAAGIDSVVFDRGGNLYHGRVKALAEAAREEGLKF
ncbi:MAG: 50S ribosomal protein L18 [bacterium]